MKEPIVIIEKAEPVPKMIKEWAAAHSIPVISYGRSSVPDYNSGFNYDHIIEYSSDITIDYLEIAYCHAHDLPAVIAVSDRLIIKEIDSDNLPSYRELVEKYPMSVSSKSLLGLSEEEFKERHMAYIKYSYHFLGYGIWGIFPNNDQASASDRDMTNESVPKESVMIGIAGLDGYEVPSLSYALFPEYQGRGYAFEACCKVLEYASNFLDLDCINIEISIDNPASCKLANKLRDAFPELVRIKKL